MLEIGHTWQHSGSRGWITLRVFGKKCVQYLCIFFMPFTPISYSKQTDNWRIGIEVLMRKRQTEAEMKHWLPIQIAVITISTLKLCNNLCSFALLRWGGKKKKINAYLQCFWINISLWFRIIIFWSHFKKAGDYTLITYCMVGERLRRWWIKVQLLSGKCPCFTEGATLLLINQVHSKEDNESEWDLLIPSHFCLFVTISERFLLVILQEKKHP